MRIAFVAVLCLATAPELLSQEQPPASPTAAPTLTLEEALDLSRRHNPAHQQTVNDRRTAAAALWSARGQLLPSANASFGTRYQEGGQQLFNGASIGASSDVVQSSYELGLTYRVSSATLIMPRLQAANVDAVDADIAGSEALLTGAVRQQYLSVLQAQARSELQDTLVGTAQTQLVLAQARAAVGSASQLDVRRAEVALGQQRVAALQARNQVEMEKLRLFQQIGVPQPLDVRLTSTFQITEPDFTLEQVLELARTRNPGLQALRSRERVARLHVRRAQAEYAPSLSVSTGWGGYTRQYTDSEFPVAQARLGMLRAQSQCRSFQETRVAAGLAPDEDCLAYDVSAGDLAAIRSSNDQYPFDFRKAPWSISAFVSIPIFDGLAREQRVQEAAAGRADARHSIRARELALTADVTAAYLTLRTAAQTVALQTENAERARDELALAEERFRVGAVSFLEVAESRASYERAQSERITAIYDYHKAFAALESAVGRPLR